MQRLEIIKELHKNLVELKLRVELYLAGESAKFRIRTGICSKLLANNRTHDLIMQGYFRKWEHFSRDIRYPVPDPDGGNAMTLYINSLNKWLGRYGELRVMLLNHLIECCEKELENV